MLVLYKGLESQVSDTLRTRSMSANESVKAPGRDVESCPVVIDLPAAARQRAASINVASVFVETELDLRSSSAPLMREAASAK